MKIEDQLNEDRNESEYWLAKEVKPYILEFLQKEFPDSLIIQEFDKVDFFVLDENLPVEIQSTYDRERGKYKSSDISRFEDVIRRQIEQNIKISGRCWFFFDTKFLIHLQNDVGKGSSINLDWLYQLWKNEKVKIFVISHDGIIREIAKDDWNFLPKISQTCRISTDDDRRIIQKNKALISCRVLKALGFTTKEINDMYKSFESREVKNEYNNFMRYLKREENTDRETLYSDTWYSLYRIELINDILSCQLNVKRSSSIGHLPFNIGLYERNSTTIQANSNQIRIRFADKYDIAQYFPGYIRNKTMWDYLKTRWLTRNEYYGIIEGRYEFSLIKNQNLLGDY